MFKRGIAKSARKALKAIAQSGLAENFYLAGGTAAAIHMGHRLSLDLDYFSATSSSIEEISKVIQSGALEAVEIRPSRGTLHCTIADTSVSFLHYEYPLLEEDSVFENTRIASLLDIALMKMTAIASRGLKKDFIDLYFILHEIALQEIVDCFPRKYPIDKLEPYHYLKSLTFFDDADADPMPTILKPCEWKEVKSSLKAAVRGISFLGGRT